MKKYDKKLVLEYFNDGDERLYEIVEELDDEEIEELINYWVHRDLIGSADLQHWLWQYLDFRNEE